MKYFSSFFENDVGKALTKAQYYFSELDNLVFNPKLVPDIKQHITWCKELSANSDKIPNFDCKEWNNESTRTSLNPIITPVL